MIHSIIAFLFFFNAHAEVYMGLEHSSENKCDLDLVRGVENQISRALCMESLDPVCLQEYYKKKLLMPAPQYGTNAVGDRKSTTADAINLLSDPKYHLGNNQKIMASWLSSTNTSPKKAHCRPSVYSPTQKEIGSWQINPADLIEGTLGWVPILGNVISSVKNLMNSMSYIDLDKSEPETTCNWSSINVSTIKEGADCVPYYNVESPAVRHFLRQSDTHKTKHIKDPNTCAYYNKLLAIVYSRNEVVERRILKALPPLEAPTCMGKDKVSFDLSIPQPGTDKRYKVDANTSKANPNFVVTGIMTPAPNVDLTIKYEDRGYGHLCERPKSNGFGVDKEMTKIIAASNLASAITSACCENGANTQDCISQSVYTKKKSAPESKSPDEVHHLQPARIKQ